MSTSLPVPRLEQTVTCLFCPNATCNLCSSNQQELICPGPNVESPSLPQITVASPDTLATKVLESFLPNKKRLYAPAKKNGRANWTEYKWMPNSFQLLRERSRAVAKGQAKKSRKEK